MVQPSRRRDDHAMATPNPVPPPPEDPARDVLSYIPVFEVVVGTGVLLAAAGLALAVVPALRRRRELGITWMLVVSAYVLTILGSGLRILLEPSLTSYSGQPGFVVHLLSEPLAQLAIGSVLLGMVAVILAIVPALRRRRALIIVWVLCVSALLIVTLVNLGLFAA